MGTHTSHTYTHTCPATPIGMNRKASYVALQHGLAWFLLVNTLTHRPIQCTCTLVSSGAGSTDTKAPVSCGPYSNCWHHTHIQGEWRVPWPRKIIKIEFNETSQAEVMSTGHSQTRLFTPSGSILTPNPFIFPCLLLTKPSPPAPHFATSDSSSQHSLVSLVWPHSLCSPAFPTESHTPRQQGPGAQRASPIDSRWWVSHPAHGLIPLWEESGPRLLFHGYVIGVPPPAIVLKISL